MDLGLHFLKRLLQNFVSIICNLAAFRHCLAEYTVHSLSHVACLPRCRC